MEMDMETEVRKHGVIHQCTKKLDSFMTQYFSNDFFSYSVLFMSPTTPPPPHTRTHIFISLPPTVRVRWVCARLLQCCRGSGDGVHCFPHVRVCVLVFIDVADRNGIESWRLGVVSPWYDSCLPNIISLYMFLLDQQLCDAVCTCS